MNKARRRLQKQRKACREWESNFSFTQAEILKATAEKGVQHGWSTNIRGKDDRATPK